MDKRDLQKLLERPFSAPLWREVLASIFGARILHNKAQPIPLPKNSISTSGYELGFLSTSDDRVVGLYQIDISTNVKLERNKVQLRELTRDIYKYDVDGAIVAFNQGDNWRLSFISEIRVLRDDGTMDKRSTEPKRFTYLLGVGIKAKTPTDRLSVLAGKRLSLEDLRNAFSVEALNKEFYQQIAEQFYELVGASTGKGRKLVAREAALVLPGLSADTSENKRIRQEFAVRLIGRVIFCWFLKVKRSERQLPLLPDSLLSSESAKKNKNYYHSVLEPLFFQILNRPIGERITDLPEGADSIPFLNGGLFEAQVEDFYNSESTTGSCANDALKIPDDWFVAMFEKLEQYNFTIDENSPTEIEVSVDPEMLGRIFENLLAEIDPDSGESARKSTGSFYTPREIVTYMVDESLKLYLKGKLIEDDVAGTVDDKVERLLRELFSYRDPKNPFTARQTRQLISAIDECKILDPACGSGAFPMGALQRLVHLLGKLDPDNQCWKKKQLEKLGDLIESAAGIDDPKVRKEVLSDLNKRHKDIHSDFAKKELDYGRKLFLIENCIHGVDIQPIAAEISKLRCFLTLIVDDSVNDNEPNRGVNPLPNLEFKFVTADALLKLPASGLFNSDMQLTKLEAVRHEYINSIGATKENAKRHFQEIQDEISEQQNKNFSENQDKRAIALSTWKPFGHDRVDWFDPELMFGLKAFDIIIGNPPYLFVTQLNEEQKREYSSKFYTYSYRYDVYGLFIERSFTDLMEPTGVLSFIIPHTLLNNDSFEKLRKFLLDKTSILALIDLGGGVFGGAKNETMMLFAGAGKSPSRAKSYVVKSDKNLRGINEGLRVSQDNFYKSPKFAFLLSVDRKSSHLLERLRQLPQTLGDICTVNQGLRTGDNTKYLSETKTLPTHKPAVGGRNIGRYIAKPVFFVQYEPAKLDAPRNEAIFTSPEKLIVQEIRNIALKDRIIACYDDKQLYCLQSTNVINVQKGKTENLKFLLGLLNSSTLNWFFRASFPSNNHIASNQLAQLPIQVTDETRKRCLENVVDYIVFLKMLEEAEPVSEFVSNGHVIQQFEEVIDALVYELYFEEDFRNADIAFHPYAARDFDSLKELGNREKLNAIKTTYQRLREKNNEVRNNLKLVDIRLANLISPIKNTK